MLATMVGRRQKFLKLDWPKHLKIVSNKRNLHQKINNSKSHIQSLSFSFRFSSRKSQSQHKLPKKITHFPIQFDSKNINSNLNSLNSLAKWLSFCLRTMQLQVRVPLQSLMLLQHCQKLYSFYKCFSKYLHCTISRRPRTAFSKYLKGKCLYILV